MILKTRLEEERRKREYEKDDINKVRAIFQSIGERVEAIDKLAEIAEDQNVEVQYRLDLIGEDRPMTERILRNKLPGAKIRDMMELWGQQKIETNDDIEEL